MPRHADGELPESEPGAIVSIADKLDTIASFFAINRVPTGSQDPYSLRRQATGIVQTLAKKEWDLDFSQLLKNAIHKTISFSKRNEDEIYQDLIAFFNLRFKHLLSEREIRYDIIDAVLQSPIKDLKSLLEKAKVLNSKKDEVVFKEEVEALSRVINIAKKAEETIAIQASLFENDAEHRLYEKVEEVVSKFNEPLNIEEQYRLLVGLKEFINDYFDNTMVMAENLDLRNNRLSLMKQLADVILSFAHFTTIVVK